MGCEQISAALRLGCIALFCCLYICVCPSFQCIACFSDSNDLTCKQSSLHANKHNVPEEPGWRCDVVMYPCYFVLVVDPWELKHATRKISPTNNQANIVELHPASVYSIRMYSYNKIGRSQASKELTISTEEARTSPTPDLALFTHLHAVPNLYLLLGTQGMNFWRISWPFFSIMFTAMYWADSQVLTGSVFRSQWLKTHWGRLLVNFSLVLSLSYHRT